MCVYTYIHIYISIWYPSLIAQYKTIEWTWWNFFFLGGTIYVYIYMYIYRHTYIHTYVHTYIHTYLCIYIHIHWILYNSPRLGDFFDIIIKKGRPRMRQHDLDSKGVLSLGSEDLSSVSMDPNKGLLPPIFRWVNPRPKWPWLIAMWQDLPEATDFPSEKKHVGVFKNRSTP